MTDDDDGEDHPPVPAAEWDGRHVNYDTETCRICGGPITYIGDPVSYLVRCEASDQTLHIQ